MNPLEIVLHLLKTHRVDMRARIRNNTLHYSVKNNKVFHKKSLSYEQCARIVEDLYENQSAA